MSSASASSRLAAICLALASTSVEATCTALPAVCSEREPIVPDAAGHGGGVGVDELDRSIGMPRTSLASMANAVWWPWPCTLVPTNMLAEPSSWTSTAPYSTCSPIGAVTSTYDDRPMPSCTRVAALAAGRLLGAQLVVARTPASTASSALAYSPES